MTQRVRSRWFSVLRKVRTKGPDIFLPGWHYNVLVGIGWGGGASWV
ncbi:hypothetical protein [Streptomyces kronopolitis]